MRKMMKYQLHRHLMQSGDWVLCSTRWLPRLAVPRAARADRGPPRHGKRPLLRCTEARDSWNPYFMRFLAAALVAVLESSTT